MDAYTEMFSHVGSYLNTVEEVQPPPLHSQLGESWWSNVMRDWQQVLKDVDISGEDIQKATEVLECFQVGYSHLMAAAMKKEVDETETDASMQALLQKPQSVQRTGDWYREMKEVLSASEFYQLFGSPRARGQLVLSKVVSEEKETGGPSQRTCCLTVEMTPLDWGIRFEPVAKQILEDKWGAQIAEMGRVHHSTHKGLAASPDGLIVKAKDAEMLGDLVEIKCPSSREIGKQIPASYWYQMQLQLEVTQRHMCHYCEFNFKSYTAQKPETCEVPSTVVQKGMLVLIQNEELPAMKYLYGPLGEMEWTPQLEEGWEIVERIPWYLEKLWIQPVIRDEAWFESICPLIDLFWQDVEKARNGEFVAPESSVKKKPVICAIVD